MSAGDFLDWLIGIAMRLGAEISLIFVDFDNKSALTWMVSDPWLLEPRTFHMDDSRSCRWRAWLLTRVADEHRPCTWCFFVTFTRLPSSRSVSITLESTEAITNRDISRVNWRTWGIIHIYIHSMMIWYIKSWLLNNETIYTHIYVYVTYVQWYTNDINSQTNHKLFVVNFSKKSGSSANCCFDVWQVLVLSVESTWRVPQLVVVGDVSGATGPMVDPLPKIVQRQNNATKKAAP